MLCFFAFAPSFPTRVVPSAVWQVLRDKVAGRTAILSRPKGKTTFFGGFFCTDRKNVLHLHLERTISLQWDHMVDVAQLVRASDCGSEGRGFEPLLPPQGAGKGSAKTSKKPYVSMICKAFLFLYGSWKCIFRQRVRGQIVTCFAPDRK